jgi:hypothetical protein
MLMAALFFRDGGPLQLSSAVRERKSMRNSETFEWLLKITHRLVREIRFPETEI